MGWYDKTQVIIRSIHSIDFSMTCVIAGSATLVKWLIMTKLTTFLPAPAWVKQYNQSWATTTHTPTSNIKYEEILSDNVENQLTIAKIHISRKKSKFLTNQAKFWGNKAIKIGIFYIVFGYIKE